MDETEIVEWSEPYGTIIQEGKQLKVASAVWRHNKICLVTLLLGILMLEKYKRKLLTPDSNLWKT